jgi:hypothetical protein
MRRTLIAAVLSITALVGLVAVAPAASAHGYGTNGCSVPFLPPNAGDQGPGFNFHEACDQHDRCYVFHAAGGGYAGRKACDDMFYRLMADSVWRQPWWNWNPGWGLNVAGTYYWFVRAFGGQAFEDSNKWHRANVAVTSR